jgi:hypothetical protein
MPLFPCQVQQHIAVAIDQPLVEFERMSPVIQPRSTTNIDWRAVKKAIMGFLASRNFQTAVKATAIVVGVVLTLSFLSRFTKTRAIFARSSDADEGSPDGATIGNNPLRRIFSSATLTLSSFGIFARNRLVRLREMFRKPTEELGVPMPFDSQNDNEGWGVCTLRAKRRLGRSSFVQYEFDLPEPDYFLPLDLGQQISVCCLDNSNSVAKGEFFPYKPESKPRLGTFSILAPNRTPPENEFAIGDDAANFVSLTLWICSSADD